MYNISRPDQYLNFCTSVKIVELKIDKDNINNVLLIITLPLLYIM